MNLYFLVEGDRTEKKVYGAWVGHAFPALEQVTSADQLAGRHYVVVKTGGYPAYLDRIEASLRDAAAHGADHLFICVDAEEVGRPRRITEVKASLAQALDAIGADDLPAVHIIVAECCIETWFLGHREMMSPQPRDPTLAEWRRFYDVRTDDPEAMDAPRDRYRTKAAFHGDYLKAMLRERSPRLRYTKARPGPVLEPAYLDALRARTVDTTDLDSLRHLLSIWDGMGGAR